jgi:hypothetical protein
MNEFLELVTQRPDPKLWKKGTFCPYCKSKNVQSFGTMTTLVGYAGKDMNHTHERCRCTECNKEFTRETKGYDNVWFTDPDGKILLGIPYCFEHYVYTCKHCGGDVVHKFYNISDDKEAQFVTVTVSSQKGIPSVHHQYCVFECQQCHEKIRSENDYMHAS